MKRHKAIEPSDRAEGFLEAGFASRREAAAYLGCSVSLVAKLLATHALPYTRVVTKPVIPWTALREYARRGLVDSSDDAA